MDEETQPRRVQTVRCKFRCNSVKKQTGWGGHEFLYSAEMSAVTGGSKENEKFFAATPSGSLTVGAVVPDYFQPGQEYYLDITPAD
jgi:hypothetical protein